MSDYAKPDVLVDTGWVEAHLGDDTVRLIEVDEDIAAYDKGHIEGAVGWNWTTDLHTKVGRESSAGRAGGAPVGRGRRTGHDRRALRREQQLVRGLRLLDLEAARVRQRQAAERRAKEVGARVPPAHAGCADVPGTGIAIAGADRPEIRAWRDEVISKIGTVGLVDVRSPEEYRGEKLAPDHLPAGAVPGPRTRPRRGEHPVGEGGERGRHVQVRRRAPRAVRR